MIFATRFIPHYPPHIGHVATLPWEIRNSNYLQIFSRYRTSSSAMAERPRELGDFKKARVNGGTDNQSLKDSQFPQMSPQPLMTRIIL